MSIEIQVTLNRSDDSNFLRHSEKPTKEKHNCWVKLENMEWRESYWNEKDVFWIGLINFLWKKDLVWFYHLVQSFKKSFRRQCTGFPGSEWKQLVSLFPNFHEIWRLILLMIVLHTNCGKSATIEHGNRGPIMCLHLLIKMSGSLVQCLLNFTNEQSPWILN